MKRLRIVSDGKPGGTKVFDADTGEPVRYVRSVTFEHDARSSPIVKLELVTGIDGAEIELTGEEMERLFSEAPQDGAATVSSSFNIYPTSEPS